MNGRWYFTRGGQPGGPVELTRLREMAASGEISPADIVWSSGVAGRPAGLVEGLFPQEAPSVGHKRWLPLLAAFGTSALLLACLAAAVWR